MQELKEITSDWVQHFTKEKVDLFYNFKMILESSINFIQQEEVTDVFPNWLNLKEMIISADFLVN